MEDKKKPSAKAAGSAGSSKKKNAGKSDAEVVEKKKVTRTSVSTSESNVPRLRKKYDSEISKELVSTLNLKNVMEAPKLKKITTQKQPNKLPIKKIQSSANENYYNIC